MRGLYKCRIAPFNAIIIIIDIICECKRRKHNGCDLERQFQSAASALQCEEAASRSLMGGGGGGGGTKKKTKKHVYILLNFVSHNSK